MPEQHSPDSPDDTPRFPTLIEVHHRPYDNSLVPKPWGLEMPVRMGRAIIGRLPRPRPGAYRIILYDNLLIGRECGYLDRTAHATTITRSMKPATVGAGGTLLDPGESRRLHDGDMLQIGAQYFWFFEESSEEDH